MKKILIFMLLIAVTEAKINIGWSINTTHINSFDENRHDYAFVEDNNVFVIEYEKNKELIGITAFKNSFGNDTIGLYVGNIKDKNNKGLYFVYRVGCIKGYNDIDYLPSLKDKNLDYGFRNHTVFYKDYSLLAEVGAGYTFNNKLAIETNLISNAIVTSIKYSF